MPYHFNFYYITFKGLLSRDRSCIDLLYQHHRVKEGGGIIPARRMEKESPICTHQQQEKSLGNRFLCFPSRLFTFHHQRHAVSCPNRTGGVSPCSQLRLVGRKASRVKFSRIHYSSFRFLFFGSEGPLGRTTGC